MRPSAVRRASTMVVAVAIVAVGLPSAAMASPWVLTPTSQVNGDYEVLSGDFTGDGRVDLFFYAPGAGPDYLRVSNGDHTFADGIPMTVNGVYETFVGDFVGPSGADDIVWRAPGGSTGYIWVFGPGGGYTSHPVTFPAGSTGVHLDHGRLGPRRDELLWYRPGPGGDRVDRFAISGAAVTRASRAITVNGAYTPVTGDFDANGWIDVFWYGPGSIPDFVWHHTSANGVFTTGHTSTARPVNGHYRPLTGRFGTPNILGPNDAAEDIYLWAPQGHTYLLTGGGAPFGQYSWSHDVLNTESGGFYRIPEPLEGAPVIRDFVRDELFAAQSGADHRIFYPADVFIFTTGLIDADDVTVVTGDFALNGEESVYLYRGSAGPEQMYANTP